MFPGYSVAESSFLPAYPDPLTVPTITVRKPAGPLAISILALVGRSLRCGKLARVSADMLENVVEGGRKRSVDYCYR